MFARRCKVYACVVSLLACNSTEPRRAEAHGSAPEDAAVYAAVTAAWRIRSSKMLSIPGEVRSLADSVLAASIEYPTFVDTAATYRDLARFAVGIGRHYSRDTAFSPQIPIVRFDSTFHPWPRSVGATPSYMRRTLRLSKVVYLDDGQSALVFVSFGCCGNVAAESLLRLPRRVGVGWVVVHDALLMIS